MGLSRAVLSAAPYASGDKQKQAEPVSVERVGPRTPYSTTAPHEGSSLSSDTELWTPRLYMLDSICSGHFSPRLSSHVSASKDARRAEDFVSVPLCTLM